MSWTVAVGLVEALILVRGLFRFRIRAHAEEQVHVSRRAKLSAMIATSRGAGRQGRRSRRNRVIAIGALATAAIALGIVAFFALRSGAVPSGAASADGAAAVSTPAPRAPGAEEDRTMPSLTARAIAVGTGHACAIRGDDGAVLCWGRGEKGQLGAFAQERPANAPHLIASLRNARAIAAGEAHTCALVERAVYCWGSNWSGQLGVDDRRDNPTPGAVPELSGAAEVSVGAAFNCAINAAQRAVCWGQNDYGQLGNGKSQPRGEPQLVVDLFRVTDVSAGWNHACAIRADKSVVCWGHNGEGQLGGGRPIPSSPIPIVVKGFTVGADAVVAGGAHSCALREDGTVICWGSNRSGQLGNGETGGRSLVPVKVRGLTDAVSLSVGAGDHTCAIKKDKTAVCWGSNDAGELGSATTGPMEHGPVAVPKMKNVVSIAAHTGGHTCAIHDGGEVTCWGKAL